MDVSSEGLWARRRTEQDNEVDQLLEGSDHEQHIEVFSHQDTHTLSLQSELRPTNHVDGLAASVNDGSASRKPTAPPDFF